MLLHVLALSATALGLVGALALFGQARALLRAGSACEVSILFLAITTAGYLTWLIYGMVLGDLALIVVDAAGLLGAAATLSVAIRLRRNPCPLCRSAVETDNADSTASAHVDGSSRPAPSSGVAVPP